MTTAIRLFLFTSLFAFAAIPVQADLPKSLDFDGNTLEFNGKGVRKKWMMNIYEAGLYLAGGKSSDGAAIVAADAPMAIRLDMVSGLITSDKMEDALMEGLDNSTGGNIGPLQSYVEEFIAVFREEIKEGDVFDLAYIPGKGLDIFKNGAFRSTVDGGMPFKQAIFGIWLGDKPADKNLKKGMLGG
jgi:hypothetical protein